MMFKTRHSIFVLAVVAFVFVCGLAHAQQEEEATVQVTGPMDLEKCVLYGLENNPTMVAVRAQLLGSKYSKHSALADMFPSSTVSYGWEHKDRKPKNAAGNMAAPQDGWSLHLNLHQPIFTGFRLLSTYQRAALTREQNEAKLYDTELSLIKEIQANFLGLLKARMDVKSAQDSVERLKSQLKVTSAFYDVGLKPRLDVLQAEVDLATAEQNLLTAKNAVSTQTAKMNTLLNLPLSKQVEYVGKLFYVPFDLNLEDCLKRAYTNRPDIQMGIKSVEIAGKNSKIAASAYYPEISADYDYYRTGDEPVLGKSRYLTNSQSEYWTAGVNMNWKFFQSGSTYFSHKAARRDVDRVEAELETTRLNAGYSVKEGFLSLKEAADRIGVARKSVEAAKESYRMAVARYQAQVGTNTDVLDAQARVSSSESQLINAQADYQTALASIYVAMGEKNSGLVVK